MTWFQTDRMLTEMGYPTDLAKAEPGARSVRLDIVRRLRSAVDDLQVAAETMRAEQHRLGTQIRAEVAARDTARIPGAEPLRLPPSGRAVALLRRAQ